MAKELIIAEKPSVAADIARALGGFTRHGDYFESDSQVLSSARMLSGDSARLKTEVQKFLTNVRAA